MEWIEKNHLAILPIYSVEHGNSTLVIDDEDQTVVKKTIKTAVKKLCEHNHVDQKAANSYYGKKLSIRTGIPIVLSLDRIYIQLKVREPIGKDDGAMGYFRLNGISQVLEREGRAVIRLKNNAEIPCLCTAETARKAVAKGELVKDLKTNVAVTSVREALEYYYTTDAPAMKSDIARLCMKVDDIFTILKTLK